MRSLLIVLCALFVVASLLAPVAAQEPPVDRPPAMAGQAVSLLPPGNSGFVSADGQAAGMGGGSYGENTDDQTATYWDLQGYAGQGFADPAAAVRTDTLADGAVRIYWDDLGVPAIYGDTDRDVWLGAGYAIAQIRLFLMDAVRRQGRGTFAALVGPSGVPMDVMTKTLTYSEAEYQAILDGLSEQGRNAVEGYVEGANLWIDQVTADPSLLPAEYGLLSTVPEPLDAIDVLAAGVLITRFVAAEGGQEMDNVRLLRELEADLGSAAGRGVFTDLVWQEDQLAVTTVPRAEGTFPNSPLAADGREAAFQAAADYAATLPLELADGPGTGAFPEPQSGPNARSEARPEGDPGVLLAARAAASLREWAESLHGGSIAVAIGPSQTAADNAMLLSGPQLGYTYPSLLVELEVHGGGYDARGASVPALPTVGIGYTDRVAWALTTGYSKTVDSFIEQVRGPDDALEYFHDGQWKAADCRTESVSFREGTQGAPVGPAVRSVDFPVCRTVHGPIVASVAVPDGEGERFARSVQYQMFGQEIDTVEGVLAWNRAKDLDDFEAAMRLVTWNENTTYADADGHIAYWHPGIHRERAAFDLRFPMPGDGSADFGAVLPFESLPQSVDPGQGFLANWNNKPAFEWLDGVGMGPTSRPGGAVQRVANPIELVQSRDDHTFATLQDLEVEAGLRDPRAAPFLPLIDRALAASGDASLSPVRALLAGWNRRFYDPANAPTTFGGPGGGSADGTDSPAATVFDAVLEALLTEVFGAVWDGRPADPDVAASCNGAVPGECPDLFSRQLGVGGHRYDMSPTHNLLLRVIDPSSSSLTPSRDYLGGRSVDAVVLAAVEGALEHLTATYGSDSPDDFRRPTHRSVVDSLTGVIGPSSVQPYMDRGSYIHVAAFDGLGPLPVVRASGPERVATSVAASQAAFPDGAETVVLAAAGSYPDALLAAPLTGLLSAPLLLVDGSLSAGVLAEIQRLGAGLAVIVGSEESVSNGVLAELDQRQIDSIRLGGDDAFEVGAAVAAYVTDSDRDPAPFQPNAGVALPDAFVVSAEAFPDALSIAGVAARTGTPILMVEQDSIPSATADALADMAASNVVVVGGTAVVSEAVFDDLPSPVRLSGPERYTTAEAVLRYARSVGLLFDTLVLATGANFPDSLTGGAVAAALQGVVVLADGLSVDAPGAALDYARSQRASVTDVLALGGTAVISQALLDSIN